MRILPTRVAAGGPRSKRRAQSEPRCANLAAMRSSLLPKLALAGCLLCATAHAVGRQPKDFQPPQEATAEEIAAEKERSRNNNMSAYQHDNIPVAEPIPWVTVGFFGLVVLVVTPFAIRAFRNTAREISPEPDQRKRRDS